MKIPSTPQVSKPIQLTSKSTLQHPETTAQPKTFTNSRPQTKFILILQTSFGMQAKPKMVSREIPNTPIQYIGPLLNQWKNHYKTCQEKRQVWTWTWTLTLRNLHIRKVLYHETYQRPDRLYFQEPPELDSPIGSNRLVQKYLPK